MSAAIAVAAFAGGAVVSLATSWLLVSRLVAKLTKAPAANAATAIAADILANQSRHASDAPLTLAGWLVLVTDNARRRQCPAPQQPG